MHGRWQQCPGVAWAQVQAAGQALQSAHNHAAAAAGGIPPRHRQSVEHGAPRHLHPSLFTAHPFTPLHTKLADSKVITQRENGAELNGLQMRDA